MLGWNYIQEDQFVTRTILESSKRQAEKVNSQKKERKTKQAETKKIKIGPVEPEIRFTG